MFKVSPVPASWSIFYLILSVPNLSLSLSLSLSLYSGNNFVFGNKKERDFFKRSFIVLCRYIKMK